MSYRNLAPAIEPASRHTPSLPQIQNFQIALTTQETATVLGLSLSVVERLIRTDPSFPCFRIGKRILINRRALQGWLDAKTLTASHYREENE